MTPEERERYSRQVLFRPIGEEGQRRLRKARAAIVGCGALGSFQAAALARAGVGYLRLIDRDYVDLSNLHRQWLYTEADAEQGLPKAIAARNRIAAINRGVEVDARVEDLTALTAGELLEGVELLLDGTDNFQTRYLINDYAVRNGVPWIYGAAVGSYGLTMPVIPRLGPCLKCLYPSPPSGVQPTCDTEGILNTVTSAVASLQVSMAVRLLVEGPSRLPRTLTTLDLWAGSLRQLPLGAPDAECPACGKGEFAHLEGAKRVPISLCGRNAVQIHDRRRRVDLEELALRLAPLGTVRANEFALRFFLPDYELTVFPDGRAIVKGTTDIGIARSLYDRYVGS